MFNLKMLGFKKSTELDMQIALFACRIAWTFVTITLLIWSFKVIPSTGKLPIQFLVLSASLFVYSGLYLYYKNKLGE